MTFNRRTLLGGAAALGGVSFLPTIAHAKGQVVATTYPGTWEDAYRTVVARCKKRTTSISSWRRCSPWTRSARPRPRAAHRRSTSSCSIPVPASSGSRAGCSRSFDAKKLGNLAKLPAGFTDDVGVHVSAQVVASPINPKKLPAPKGWGDLLKDPWVSRLGITASRRPSAPPR